MKYSKSLAFFYSYSFTFTSIFNFGLIINSAKWNSILDSYMMMGFMMLFGLVLSIPNVTFLVNSTTTKKTI
jgi:hypothetical protein